jgi:hypothetical protein
MRSASWIHGHDWNSSNLCLVFHEVPLTDIRALMLAAHIGLPLPTLGEEPMKSLREHVGARTLWQLDIRADRLALEQGLNMYGELAAEVGYYLSQRLGSEEAFDGLVGAMRAEPAVCR